MVIDGWLDVTPDSGSSGDSQDIQVKALSSNSSLAGRRAKIVFSQTALPSVFKELEVTQAGFPGNYVTLDSSSSSHLNMVLSAGQDLGNMKMRLSLDVKDSQNSAAASVSVGFDFSPYAGLGQTVYEVSSTGKTDSTTPILSAGTYKIAGASLIFTTVFPSEFNGSVISITNSNLAFTVPGHSKVSPSFQGSSYNITGADSSVNLSFTGDYSFTGSELQNIILEGGLNLTFSLPQTISEDEME